MMKILICNPDYMIIEYNNCFKIRMFTSNKITFIDTGLRITYTLSDCAYLLKELAYTPDLENFWETTMATNSQIATSFYYKYFNILQDPLEGYAIEQLCSEMLDLAGIRYYRLWELINISFSEIKSLLKNSPNSAEELFLQIATYELLRGFEILVENSYVEYSPSLLSKYAEEMSKNQPDYNVVKQLTPIYAWNNTNDLLNEVLKNCFQISRKNRKVALAGETYNLATRYFWESVSRFTKARKRTGHQEQKTVIYQNGEIL